jgi:hypothetical protein
MHIFAYPWKEFRDPDGKKTPILKSAIDAFNIFDLCIEIWRNARWVLLAVVLRRPYAKDPEMERMDFYGAMMGTRNTAAYGKSETESYAMLNVPDGSGASQHEDEEAPGDYPKNLRPAPFKFSDQEDEVDIADESESKPSPLKSDPPAYRDFAKDTGYSNTYKQEKRDKE